MGYYYDGNSIAQLSGGTAFGYNCNFLGHRVPDNQVPTALWVEMSGENLDASLAADTSALVGRDHGAFTAPATGYDYGWDPSGAQFIAPEDGLFSVTAACQLYSSTTSSIARYTRLALVDVNSELVVSAPGPEAPCQPLGPKRLASLWARTKARGPTP